MALIFSRQVKRYFRYAILILVVIIFLPVLLQTFRRDEGWSDDRGIEGRGRRVDVEIPDVPGFHQAVSIVQREYHLLDGDSRKVFGFDPKSLAKRDWTNYTRVQLESKRTGPGEQGLAYRVSTGEIDQTEKDRLYRANGFNALGSDHISLDRAIKDIRPKGCKSKLYLEKLPVVSVILPFHNEHWTTLLRSVHSIVHRSPRELLKEVVLADDYSSKDFLKKPLDDYVQEHFPGGIVKIVRAEKREGLIRARLLGARAASGQVLLFLDSHSECNVNWLAPLLEPIAYDYRTVVCPFVDVVDYETFEYRAQDEGARGAWDWELYYKRLPLLPEDKEDPTKPFKSPVMAGGYFAISTKWFWELGGYDEGLDIWGGEQYELSFKLWQCGGKMVDVACSHVGHIYRKFAPFPNPGVGDFMGRNYKRVAEVWMDEFKEYIYKRRPHYRNVDPGDLSKQRALREKLKCKSFKWFMENVAFDQSKKYPPIEPPLGAHGEIRNVAADLCIDTRFKTANERFELQPCVKDDPKANMGEQNFEFTWHKDIRPRRRHLCLDVSKSSEHAPVVLFSCHGMQGNQQWKYRLGPKQLYHPISRKCMDCDPERREIFMSACSGSKDSQKWNIEHINATLIKRWGQNVRR